MEMLICDGVVSASVDGYPVCDTGWLTQISAVPFDYTQISPELATMMFVGGFFLPLTPWVAVWGLRELLRSIRS